MKYESVLQRSELSPLSLSRESRHEMSGSIKWFWVAFKQHQVDDTDEQGKK